MRCVELPHLCFGVATSRLFFAGLYFVFPCQSFVSGNDIGRNFHDSRRPSVTVWCFRRRRRKSTIVQGTSDGLRRFLKPVCLRRRSGQSRLGSRTAARTAISCLVLVLHVSRGVSSSVALPRSSGIGCKMAHSEEQVGAIMSCSVSLQTRNPNSDDN